MSEQRRAGEADEERQGGFYTDEDERERMLEDSDATPGPAPSNPAEAAEGDE
jgi:hypothetical protein